ncbi:MAG: CAP domain-containing protein [Dehalococcoidia bacterium]
MRRIALFLALAALAFGAIAGWPARPTSAGPNCTVDASIDSEEALFLVLINQHRANNGRQPLQLSDKLNKAAAWKSKHMADNNYFAHNDTPINRTWDQRIRDCGYNFNTYLGENIAAGNSGAQATFNQWLDSPGHNANMLSSNFTAIGIGRYFNSSATYDWYWTTDFGGVQDGYSGPTSPTATRTATHTPTSTPTATPTRTPTPPLPPASGIDTDGDGCDDAYENSANVPRGGGRDPNNPWDFFDTPDAANVRDAAITVADMSRVVGRFGSTGSMAIPLFTQPAAPPVYHTAFDRSPNGAVSGSPNGSVTAADISVIVMQFGHSCA